MLCYASLHPLRLAMDRKASLFWEILEIRSRGVLGILFIYHIFIPPFSPYLPLTLTKKISVGYLCYWISVLGECNVHCMSACEESAQAGSTVICQNDGQPKWMPEIGSYVWSVRFTWHQFQDKTIDVAVEARVMDSIWGSSLYREEKSWPGRMKSRRWVGDGHRI